MKFEEAKKFLEQCLGAIDAAIQTKEELSVMRRQLSDAEKTATTITANATHRMKSAEEKLLRANEMVAQAKAEAEKVVRREREQWESQHHASCQQAEKELQNMESAVAIKRQELDVLTGKVAEAEARMRLLTAQIVTAKKDLHRAVDNA